MRWTAFTCFMALALWPLTPEADPGTFVRLRLQHPIGNWFPVDIHSDGQWELAILTAESPQQVGVYDARQRRWIDGPRILPVASALWTVGDVNDDSTPEYYYLQGRSFWRFDAGTSVADSLWTIIYDPIALQWWGLNSTGTPAVAILKHHDESVDCGGEPGPHCCSRYQRTYVRLVSVATGDSLGTFLSSQQGGTRISHCSSSAFDAFVSYVSQGAVIDCSGSGVYGESRHWMIYVGSAGLPQSTLGLPNFLSPYGPAGIYSLWALESMSPLTVPSQDESCVAWLTGDGAWTGPYDSANSYLPLLLGVHRLDSSRAIWIDSMQVNKKRYVGLAAFDIDSDGEDELLLPLSSGVGCEVRNSLTGTIEDTLCSMPVAQLSALPLVNPCEKNLFYFADSTLYIFQHDSPTGILDDPNGDLTDNVDAAHFSLAAVPNPFNAAVTLSWPAGIDAQSLTIYNILGQEVRNYRLSQGSSDVTWDGRDVQGRGVASGVYFARLVTRGAVRTAKLVMLR